MNRYYHWGQMGDIVYSIPTIQRLGPGVLVSSMRKDRLDSLAPLLLREPNIIAVEHDPRGRMENWSYRPKGITHDLNKFRALRLPLNRVSLIAAHLRAFKLDETKCWKPWLTPWTGGGGYAVIARSARYHNAGMDWKTEYETAMHQFGKVLFVGLESEYFMLGEYTPVRDLAHMADLIIKAEVFIGNHSLPLAIAQGVGCPRRIEVAPNHWNCEYPEDPLETRLCEP